MKKTREQDQQPNIHTSDKLFIKIYSGVGLMCFPSIAGPDSVIEDNVKSILSKKRENGTVLPNQSQRSVFIQKLYSKAYKTVYSILTGSKSSPPVYNKQKPTNNHLSSPYNSLRKPIYVSDAESVRTEDFEFRFKDLIVNQMDSETDVTDNDPLHAKVKEILQVTLPCKLKSYMMNFRY